MKTKIIKEGNQSVAFQYDKYFKNDDYEIFFNMKSGFELMRGIDKKDDPFQLELPSLIDVGIMGHCKNKCPFCYQGNDYEPHMTLENFKRIIDETKHHVNQVALGGRGDPNLHPNFREIIEYARSNGVVPNYTTSGFGLTDDQIETSKMCGAVAVSNYKTAEMYSALNRFFDAGIKTNIHFLLTKNTFFDAAKILNGDNPWVSHVPKVKPFELKKLNAVVFLLFKQKGRGEKLDWLPNEDQLRVFAKAIENSASKDLDIKIGMDSCLINHVVKHVDLPVSISMAVDTCEGARMSMYITPGMEATPCSFADKDMRVPLEGTTIKEVWTNGEPFKKFRETLRACSYTCPATKED